VDLKYITHTQIVEVVYEGHTRQFSVISISSAQPTSDGTIDDLTKGFQSFSVQFSPQIWTVGWDSSVRIVENEDDSELGTIYKVCIKARGLVS
jgi:AAA family ATPase